MACQTAALRYLGSIPCANALLPCVNWHMHRLQTEIHRGEPFERAPRGFSWCGANRIYRTAAKSLSRALCASGVQRSEERRVGKESSARAAPCDERTERGHVGGGTVAGADHD